MFGTFGRLLDVAERLGTIEEAHMYTTGFMMIGVRKADGSKVVLSLNVERETEDTEDVE